MLFKDIIPCPNQQGYLFLGVATSFIPLIISIFKPYTGYGEEASINASPSFLILLFHCDVRLNVNHRIFWLFLFQVLDQPVGKSLPCLV